MDMNEVIVITRETAVEGVISYCVTIGIIFWGLVVLYVKNSRLQERISRIEYQYSLEEYKYKLEWRISRLEDKNK